MMIRYLFALVTAWSLCGNIFAVDLPFADTPREAFYREDLEFLYTQGIVTDNQGERVDGLLYFRPNAILTRDAFVSLAVGAGCKRCDFPSQQDIETYRNSPFGDVTPSNPYFYCISYALEQDIIEGYTSEGGETYVCQDGSSLEGNSPPFCPANNITRLEAIRVLLRQSDLWDDERNRGEIPRDLEINDIPFESPDYGYARKWVLAGIVTIDSRGNLSPNGTITKGEFVTMASVTARFNRCEVRTDDTASPEDGSFWSDIRILSPSSTPSTGPSLEEIDLGQGGTIFDFAGVTEGASGAVTYTWTFTSLETGETFTATGPYLDNVSFDGRSQGTWTVILNTTDNSGNSSQSGGQFIVGNGADRSPTNTGSMSIPLVADILIFESSHTPSQGGNGEETEISNGTTTYDFYNQNTAENVLVTWSFFNATTGETLTFTGNYLDNITLPVGDYTITSTVRDGANGTSITTTSQVYIGNWAKSPSTPPSSDIRISDSSTGGIPTSDTDTFDFEWVGGGPGSTYTWTFTDRITGETITRTGQTLEDVGFADGVYDVVLTVRNPDGTSSQSNSSFVVGNGGNNTVPTSGSGGIAVQITAYPSSGGESTLAIVSPEGYNFIVDIAGGIGPYQYRWNFGDGTYSTESSPSHQFLQPGTYTVFVSVTDANGVVGYSQITVIQLPDPDSDNDGIVGSDDRCPDIAGSTAGGWCPVIEEYTRGDDSDTDGDWNNVLSVGGYDADILRGALGSFGGGLGGGLFAGNSYLLNACEQQKLASSRGVIVGSASCQACPCASSASFLADARSCDQIFAAIMSPDQKVIYGRGNIVTLP